MSELSPQAQMIRETLGMGLSDDGLRARLGSISPDIKKEVSLSLEHDEAQLRMERDIIDEIHSWMKLDSFVFEKNNCSRVHKIIEASAQNKIANRTGDAETIKMTEEMIAKAQVFVVQHDWAAAIGPAIDGEDIQLPYEQCIFEFMVSGKCLIVYAIQEEGGQPWLLGFLQTKSGWLCGSFNDLEKNPEYPLYRAWHQIIAISIALDAEVAIKEVIRVDGNLNKKRESKGKPALKDFNIVDLSRRHRVSAAGNGTHRSPRLHFRRGHWRHLDEHKTWIKWMLVGDPDLGFIEKEYRI